MLPKPEQPIDFHNYCKICIDVIRYKNHNFTPLKIAAETTRLKSHVNAKQNVSKICIYVQFAYMQIHAMWSRL